MKNEYEVTITARVTKTYRVAAATRDEAANICSEIFTLHHEPGRPSRYEETLDECKLIGDAAKSLYRVTINATVTDSHDVLAYDEDEAREKAFDLFSTDDYQTESVDIKQLGDQP